MCTGIEEDLILCVDLYAIKLLKGMPESSGLADSPSSHSAFVMLRFNMRESNDERVTFMSVNLGRNEIGKLFGASYHKDILQSGLWNNNIIPHCLVQRRTLVTLGKLSRA